MKFCPECGTRFEGSPKFCPECGTKIPQSAEAEVSSPPPTESSPTIPAPKPQPAINRHELGVRLEEVVESIFKADGYSTQRRQRIPGIKGYTNEIDIIATRGNEKVAIECKNLSTPVGISQMRDFAEKIQDLGAGWRGIFVGYNDFTEDASQFAESRNIEQIGIDEVMEKWFALSVGRYGKKGEKISIEQALPLNTDFIQATSLDFSNKGKVAVTDVKLIYHPYIRYNYHFKKIFRDPSKKQHRLEDKGTVVVDLLDNEIINAPITKTVETIARTLTQTFTKKGHLENKGRKTLLHEVIDNTPLSEVMITIGQDYRMIKLPVNYAKRDINRTAIEYIIDKNSQRITYSVEPDSVFKSDIEYLDVVPEKRDISIDKGEVVHVPKWVIHFNALGMIYSRELYACSGKIIEDTIAYCPHHFKLGVIEIRKKNSAVCEKCGMAFCNDHGRSCEVCKIMLCEKHAVICTSCKRAFCSDHISKKCGICGGYVCDKCIKSCPICGKEIGSDHFIKCDNCGKSVCSSCATTSGLIKKKTTCKKCQ